MPVALQTRVGADVEAGAARVAHAEAAFRWACALDVQVRKPGNVSVASPGHDMVAAQFLASAAAAAAPLFRFGTGVGDRVEQAVIATRAVAGCNTNLGILLLCAPVALAAERAPRADADALMAAVREALDALDVADARAAYRAIAVANPGGLGSAAAQDVAAEPTLDLKSAMALAAGRDLIARQYACGFEDILGVGLEPFRRDRDHARRSLAAGVQALFLRFLAAFPDSHIARKFGLVTARAVSAEALPWLERLQRDAAAGASDAFAAWDESLKRRGLNPGTCADLTVCSLFMAALLDPVLLECRPEDA